MAPHRKPRPDGPRVAGIRTPALATAALTSVALLSQSADAAPSAVDEKPSLEDVEQKVGDLYREAGEATGTFTVIRDRIPRQPRSSGTLREGAARAPQETRGAQGAERGAQRTGEARGTQGAPAADALFRPDATAAASAAPAGAPTGAAPAGTPAGAPTGSLAGASADLLTGGPQSRATVDTARPAAADAGVQADGRNAGVPAGGQSSAGAPAAAQNALQSSKSRIQAKLTAARALLAQHRALAATSTAAQQTGTQTVVQGGQTGTQTGLQGGQAGTQTGLGVAPVAGAAVPTSPFAETGSFPNLAQTFADPAQALSDPAQAVAAAPVTPPAAQPVAPPVGRPVAAPATSAAQAAQVTQATPQPVGDTLTNLAVPQVSAVSHQTAVPTAAHAPAAAPASAPVEDTAYTAKAAKALSFARAQIGKPYVWGATGPDAFDCAGLAQAAWKAAGVALPRTAFEQSTAGTPVEITQAVPGDLFLYFADASHTALYIGNGMIIHSPQPGGYIREDPVYYADAPIHSVVRPA